MTLWHSGHVNRWHNNPSHALRNSMDTTWAHSARVAALVYMIVPRLADVNTILAALFHDAAEVVTGDIPGPAKVGDMRGYWNSKRKTTPIPTGYPRPRLTNTRRQSKWRISWTRICGLDQLTGALCSHASGEIN